MKDSFYMFHGWYEFIKCLDGDQVKELMVAIYEHELSDGTVDIEVSAEVLPIYSFCKRTLDKLRDAYNRKCEKAKENVEKRWNTNVNERKQNNSNVSKGIQKDTDTDTVTDTETDTDIDTDTETDTDTELKNSVCNKHILSGKPDDAQAASAEVVQIIDTLNLVLGTHYKSTTPKTVKLIHDRLKEGFTVSDFEIVIRKMFRVWTGTEYEKFLRPETLFGTKFESYLNRTDTTDREIEAEKSKDRFRALYEWAARKEAERKETETNDGDGFCADSGEDTCYLPDFSSC